MSSCKKNCSCSRCKPCAVIPVSRTLKGIDVCQIPKCDCSGSVNFQSPDVEFVANICSNCNLQGSFVLYSDEPDIIFNSTIVNSPQCMPTDGGTILIVSGFGTLIYDSAIVQSAFLLQLSENSIWGDTVILQISGFDNNGVSYTITISQPVDEGELMVSYCNSQGRRMTNKASKSPQLREKLSHKQISIVKNGQIEVKELK